MKRITLCLTICLTVLTVILSGCAGRQNSSDLQSSEDNNKSVQSTENSSETNDPSVTKDLSPVEESSFAQEGSEQTNTQSAPVESTSPESETSGTPSAPTVSGKTEENMRNIKIIINEEIFSATLYNNEAAKAFAEMLPLTLDMSDYSGFEKVGSLGTSLPTDNRQTTTQSGDIVLYNGNQIVIFYGSNSWSYTRLGKINDLSGWEDALGDGDVEVTFTIVQ